MLTQIKENESNIQTEQAEAAMLNNALAVTNSSINAQQTMKASNDNQVMCSVMDSNVDDEVLQLNADLVETERLLQQVQTQLDSNSNPELLEVLAKVHEANALQAEMCADLEEARSCIKGSRVVRVFDLYMYVNFRDILIFAFYSKIHCSPLAHCMMPLFTFIHVIIDCSMHHFSTLLHVYHKIRPQSCYAAKGKGSSRPNSTLGRHTC